MQVLSKTFNRANRKLFQISVYSLVAKVDMTTVDAQHRFHALFIALGACLQELTT